MQQQADRQLQASLDTDAYDEQDLITLRVPLSLPYTTDTKDFEWIDGEINVNGIIYKYVKRKVEQGALVLLCLPDKNRTQLETAKDEFFKLANDLERNTPVKKSGGELHSLKNLLNQYDAPAEAWTGSLLIKEISEPFPPYIVAERTALLTALEQPPEHFAA